MNYRIITTDSEYPDVLLYRDRDEDSNEIVVIHAIGTIDDGEDLIASEIAIFEDSGTAQDFIRGYTKEAAERFCKKKNIGY